WLLGSQSRDAYLQKIEQKLISKPVLAGILRIKKQPEDAMASVPYVPYVDSLSRNSAACEDLSFNPWNGDIEHHKPLGVISRLKRRFYIASRRARHVLNGITDSERNSSK